MKKLITINLFFALLLCFSFTVEPKKPEPNTEETKIALSIIKNFLKAAEMLPIKRLSTDHGRFIFSIDFSSDGKLATGSMDETVKIWDIENDTMIHNFTDLTSQISSVVFCSEGKLAAGFKNGTIKIWNVKNNYKQIEHSIRHEKYVTSIDFSPDCKHFASGSVDNTVKIWDLETGNVIHNLTDHTDYPTAIAFNSNGKLLAIGLNDGVVKVWDVKTGQIRNLTGHTDSVTSVAFSPDGNYLATGSEDNTATILNVETGKIIHSLIGHTDRVLSVAFSPDGKFLATGSWDGTVKIWDVTTGRITHSLTGYKNWKRLMRGDTSTTSKLGIQISSVAFSPDGTYLAAGAWDKIVKIWTPFEKNPAIAWMKRNLTIIQAELIQGATEETQADKDYVIKANTKDATTWLSLPSSVRDYLTTILNIQLSQDFKDVLKKTE